MDWELWCMRAPFSFSLEQYCCGGMEITEGSFTAGYGGGVQDWDEYSLRLHQVSPGQAKGTFIRSTLTSHGCPFTCIFWAFYYHQKSSSHQKNTCSKPWRCLVRYVVQSTEWTYCHVWGSGWELHNSNKCAHTVVAEMLWQQKKTGGLSVGLINHKPFMLRYYSRQMPVRAVSSVCHLLWPCVKCPLAVCRRARGETQK